MQSKYTNVCKDTQVLRTTVHTREKGKSTSRSTFNYVINGMLLSAVMISSIALAGCSPGVKTQATPTQPPQTAQVQQIETKDDEATYLLNLNLAIKAIDKAKADNNWTNSTLDDLCTALAKIETGLNANILSSSSENLKTSIKETESTLKDLSFPDNVKEELTAKKVKATETIDRVKTKLGIAKEKTIPPTDKVAENQSDQATKSNPLGLPSATAPTSNTTTSTSKPSTTQQPTNTAKPTEQASAPIVTTKPAAAPAPVAQAQPSSQKATPVQYLKENWSIKTKYGTHTYGCKTQAEYNDLIKKVQEAVANRESLVWTERQQWAYTQTINKVPYSSFKEGTEEYNFLKVYQKTYAPIVTNLSQKDSKNFIQGGLLYNYLVGSGNSDPSAGDYSAYDLLFKHIENCTSQAQVASAIYDVLGYNTRIWCSTTHADAEIKIGNYWLSDGSKSPAKANPPSNEIYVNKTY